MKVFKPKLYSTITSNYNNSAVASVRRDLEEGMKCLYRLFYVEKKDYDMPVAFATNALYVLARNGLAQTPESHKLIQERLIPLLLKKQDYLHAEGLAMAAYALSEAKVWDEAAWTMLKEQISKHDFNY